MRPKPSGPPNVDPDMTPMIDIVFQLLTFFMLVINFENTKADERVKLPMDMLAKPPEVKPENELVLNIGFHRNPDGSLADPSPYIFYNGEDISVSKFGPRLEQERQIVIAKRGKEAVKEVTMILRADAEVPTGQVQELIKMSQEKGFEKFALKAMQDENVPQ